jgi:micrococcal nuclease
MKLVLLIFIIALPALSDDQCVHTATSFDCVEYVSNYDADTITFNVPGLHPILGEKMKVRVKGVDTPEIRTKDKCEKQKAKEAKAYVQGLLVKARKIRLTEIKRGKYFRVVAKVMIDGVDLSQLLLSKGHAYAYDGGTKDSINWCLSKREIASQNK